MKTRRETCMPKCVRTQIDQVALKTWGGEKTVLTPSKLVRLARRAARIALAAAAASIVMAQETAGCRVTGFVISIQPETKSQPAENQFRMRVVDSPWSWQVGASMPVTSTTPPGLKPGDAVEVSCDPARYTRRGRFWGTARKMDNQPRPAREKEPAS